MSLPATGCLAGSDTADGATPDAENVGEIQSKLSIDDQRFRTYGALTIKNYDFLARNGGTSAELCAAGNCAGDFITVGQLNDRQWGPYANTDTTKVAKKWLFLRANRPTRWDCSIGLDFSVTNWLTTTRCIDQMGTDKYEEILRNALSVSGGQEYKQDVLDQQFAAEAPHLTEIIGNWVKSRGLDTPLVFEVGNEPNVFPAMTATMYASYYARWVNEIRSVAARVAPGLSVQTMPAGLWISEGEPEAVRNVLDQGVAFAFGRVSIRVPTKVGICGHWYAPYPCVKFRSMDITPGVDVKARMFMDTTAYLNQFLAAVPAGMVDYGNLHFYPYVGPDSAYGEGNMTPHIDTLRSLSSLYAARANSRQVWLTELGNFNPFTEDDTIKKVMTPALSVLKANQIPEITRWYWFMNQGEDKKFDMLPSAAKSPLFSLALVLGDSYIMGLDALLGPLFKIVRPVTSPDQIYRIGNFVNQLAVRNPLQGLEDNAGLLRAMGNVYYNMALAPLAGAACDGTSSANPHLGCRGSGCSVCTEVVAGYPNYFRNHPNCLANSGCDGQHYTCNAACPQPDDTDK